jgi:hypothetical protein
VPLYAIGDEPFYNCAFLSHVDDSIFSYQREVSMPLNNRSRTRQTVYLLLGFICLMALVHFVAH